MGNFYSSRFLGPTPRLSVTVFVAEAQGNCILKEQKPKISTPEFSLDSADHSLVWLF